MNKKGIVFSKRVAICNELGIHARAAAKIVKISGHAAGNIWLSHENEHVDAKSVIDILTLACPCGSEATLSIEKIEDAEILSEIIKTVKKGFGEQQEDD